MVRDGRPHAAAAGTDGREKNHDVHQFWQKLLASRLAVLNAADRAYIKQRVGTWSGEDGCKDCKVGKGPRRGLKGGPVPRQ
eukprot:6180524-Pleurochrysis_carterae.AAC.1